MGWLREPRRRDSPTGAGGTPEFTRGRKTTTRPPLLLRWGILACHRPPWENHFDVIPGAPPFFYYVPFLVPVRSSSGPRSQKFRRPCMPRPCCRQGESVGTSPCFSRPGALHAEPVAPPGSATEVRSRLFPPGPPRVDKLII